MTPTARLQDVGQSLWLDNITRELMRSGKLQRHIDEDCVTGLTSNPTIFDQAISGSADYDDDIAQLASRGQSGESLFFEIAARDLAAAAELFLPIHARTAGVDGWASLEVSPALAHDAEATIEAAKRLYAQARKPNLLIKIPGTVEGLRAIEETIFSGVPVNVTLLFSPAHYLAAAEAFLRGVERRIEAGRNPCVGSVASLFVSRWDVAANEKVEPGLHNQLGLAIARQTYKAYCDWLDTPRVQRAMNAGARPQRLLWASTGTKDRNAADILYVKTLAAPFTVNTMPGKTLAAFADHGEIGALLERDGGDSVEVLRAFFAAGVDINALAAQLQDEGEKSFSKSWDDLLDCVERKSEKFRRAG